jgi:hypothetical protein
MSIGFVLFGEDLNVQVCHSNWREFRRSSNGHWLKFFSLDSSNGHSDWNFFTRFYTNLIFCTIFVWRPVRIQVRIDPPHPLVCRKRRLNGAVLRVKLEKLRCHSSVLSNSTSVTLAYSIQIKKSLLVWVHWKTGSLSADASGRNLKLLASMNGL